MRLNKIAICLLLFMVSVSFTVSSTIACPSGPDIVQANDISPPIAMDNSFVKDTELSGNVGYAEVINSTALENSAKTSTVAIVEDNTFVINYTYINDAMLAGKSPPLGSQEVALFVTLTKPQNIVIVDENNTAQYQGTADKSSCIVQFDLNTISQSTIQSAGNLPPLIVQGNQEVTRPVEIVCEDSGVMFAKNSSARLSCEHIA